MAWRERQTSFNPRRDEANGTDLVECKVIMVGTVSVGKTSLTSRYVKDAFRTNVTTTIGASYMWKKEKFGDRDVKFSLWDTAGQEQFHALVPMYFRETEAVILVVDVTSPTCADEAEMWLDKVRQNAPENTVIFLALNKIDLANDRKFTLEDAQQFLKSHPDFDIECGEVSAKTGEGVQEAFRRVGERCLVKIDSKRKATAEAANQSQGTKVNFDGGSNKRDNKKPCPC